MNLGSDNAFQIIAQDDLQPMYVEKDSEKESVMDTVWLTREQRSQLQS